MKLPSGRILLDSIPNEVGAGTGWSQKTARVLNKVVKENFLEVNFQYHYIM